MSGPNPSAAAPGGGVSPLVVGGALVVALVVVVFVWNVVSGNPKMSDGSDVTAADPGLKELTAGVQYRDLKVGVGEECPEGAMAVMHYTGWLADGTEFDTSRGRAKPFDADLNGALIAGWKEGVPGMKKGGVRKLVIAPDKGYGARGFPPKIPANATLIFEVELVRFTEPEGGAPTGPAKLTDGTAPGADDPGLRDIGGGLKIRDLKEGTGAVCASGASVSAHYTGWLLNGKVFDSSRPRGEPTTFSLGQVVPGWQRGIPGMKVGGIRKLVIPPDLAYGPTPKSGIPPNSTLVFEVELMGTR